MTQSSCASDEDCAGDAVRRICVQTNDPWLCAPSYQCVAACTGPADCCLGECCNDDTGRCEPAHCAVDEHCPAHFECHQNQCRRSPCADSSHCPGGYCVKGLCYPQKGTCSYIPARSRAVDSLPLATGTPRGVISRIAMVARMLWTTSGS